MEEPRLTRTEFAHDGALAIVTLLGKDEQKLSPWGARVCEHRINPQLVAELNAALDAVLANEMISAVIVFGEGRFFCNGMDLRWIDANLDKADELQAAAEKLLGRILCFPVPTIAAINGHFCAAGCMLGLAFDYRVMSNEDALCFVPAIDIALVYSPGMTNLMKAKCPVHMHNDLIVYAKRYSADMLQQERVVHQAVKPDAVMQSAIALAQQLTMNNRFKGKRYRDTMHKIKVNTYKDTYNSLTDSRHFQGMGFATGNWDGRGKSKI